jgi:hypothetical protein
MNLMPIWPCRITGNISGKYQCCITRQSFPPFSVRVESSFSNVPLFEGWTLGAAALGHMWKFMLGECKQRYDVWMGEADKTNDEKLRVYCHEMCSSFTEIQFLLFRSFNGAFAATNVVRLGSNARRIMSSCYPGLCPDNELTLTYHSEHGGSYIYRLNQHWQLHSAQTVYSF